MHVPGAVKVTSPPASEHPVLAPSSVTATIRFESELGPGVHVSETGSGLTGGGGNVIVCDVAARADDAPNNAAARAATTSAIPERLISPTPLSRGSSPMVTHFGERWKGRPAGRSILACSGGRA